MKDENISTDRYVSFCGIECEANADKLIEILEDSLNKECGSESWRSYFEQKQKEQQKMQRDNLHFIGNQLNPLYEYFELCQNTEASELLYQIEQECC